MRRLRISDWTRKVYQDAFDLYARWLALIGQPAVIASYDIEHLEAYADYLRERKALPGRRPFDRMDLSTSSQSGYLRSLDQFGDWLAWESLMAVNPFTQTYDSLLRKIKGTTRVLKSATAGDVRALLDATRGDDPLIQRDHAILLTGWETGMRTQDLYGLELANLDMRTGFSSSSARRAIATARPSSAPWPSWRSPRTSAPAVRARSKSPAGG